MKLLLTIAKGIMVAAMVWFYAVIFLSMGPPY